MASDHPGAPEPLARLADVLAGAAGGRRPAPLELAELLWLARHMDTGAEDPAPPEPRDGPPPDRPAPVPRERESAPRPAPRPEEHGVPRAPLHLPSPARSGDGPGGAGAEPHAALLAPAPPMLRRPLALQRALRPLKRRVESPRGRELDEHATADRLARLDAAPDSWLPVMRPARERWLRLNLVHDAGPTMPVWRPLVRELHAVLARSGVFRTVNLLRADPDGTVHGPGAHVPADGRVATLVLSDCMGPQWRHGPAGALWYGTLHRWARSAPLAVVQPLPEHLWRDTALPAVPGLLSAPYPAAPTAALAFTPYEGTHPDGTPTPWSTLPIPVLEPGPDWLANWASLLASPGGTGVPAAVAASDRPPVDRDDRTDVGRLTPEELVLRFRAAASPEAFRLAGHLALGRPDLPVMRLVQAATSPDPRPQHLAEVILSGMLTAVPGPPGSYAFRPGVRDLLLRGLPRTARNRTAELLDRVGGLIDEGAGRVPGDFLASTPSRSGTLTGPADGEAFATVSPQSARRLSGAAEPSPPRAASPPGSASRAGSAGAPRDHATVTFRADGLSGRPEARITLEYAVHQVLSRSSLTPLQYEVRVLPDGYDVRTEPGAHLLPLLVAILRGLPQALAGLPDPPRLEVLLWDAPTAPPEPPAPHGRAGVVVVVPPGLYEQFAASSAARGPARFRPVYDAGAPSAPPVAWYCPLGAADAEPPARDLVRGPFITHDLRELGAPAPGRTAVVHTRPDGTLALLNPVQPYGTRRPHPATYYLVDLTSQQASRTVTLPGARGGSFTAAVALAWHVTDPVAFVRAEVTGVAERLLAHLLDATARVTRRHPVRRAGAAQREVAAGPATWPVPGVAVSCSVRLARGGAPLPGPPRGPEPPGLRPADVLAGADTVLIGFDGPLARLFSSRTAREAALELLAVVAEHRPPHDALGGRPPAPGDVPQDALVHPLEVLRAFAHDRLGPVLRERLDAIELRAAPDAPMTYRSAALVRALHASGRRVVVVGDVGERAVRRCLRPHRLPLAGVHGRSRDPALLMPHPDCLGRALSASGASAAPAGVLIGSSVAEFTAAQQAGLPFVGYAYTSAVRRSLREAGCELTVDSMAPLLEAARSLPRPRGS